MKLYRNDNKNTVFRYPCQGKCDDSNCTSFVSLILLWGQCRKELIGFHCVHPIWNKKNYYYRVNFKKTYPHSMTFGRFNFIANFECGSSIVVRYRIDKTVMIPRHFTCVWSLNREVQHFTWKMFRDKNNFHVVTRQYQEGHATSTTFGYKDIIITKDHRSGEIHGPPTDIIRLLDKENLKYFLRNLI